MTEAVLSLTPAWAVPGGVVDVKGASIPQGPAGPPRVFVGGTEARVVSSGPGHLRFRVPTGAPSGTVPIRIEPGSIESGSLVVAGPIATGLHQVDSPAYDTRGRLYATHSGSRGVKVPVPLYRIMADGTRDELSLDLPNPTSIALGPDGTMFVSSRFEGQVYKLVSDSRAEIFAADLGVPTGLAFSRDGSLFVGDRSGTVFRVSPNRQVEPFATLPASVAAFHLAFGPDDNLYVSAPTLSTHDAVYRISPDRLVDTLCDGFGRPQGLAFDDGGMLYVADALAGASGLYRIDVNVADPVPELVAATPVVVGLAFDPSGGLNVASADTIWRFDVPLAAATRLAAGD